ncbi:MAG: hypothetical protein LBQ66_07730, partial [Planctomycetaceae bacterium]|nr:hypothetical protein [Planctomycetaceae bacterium]
KNHQDKLEQIIHNITGERSMSTLYELWTTEAAEKATAEATVKTRAETQAKAKAEEIVRILSRRLESPPQLLQQKINQVSDVDKLDELIDFAWTCVSVDEFVTAFN